MILPERWLANFHCTLLLSKGLERRSQNRGLKSCNDGKGERRQWMDCLDGTVKFRCKAD